VKPARATVVLDVGKSLSKLSLYDAAGSLIDRRTRPNESVAAGPYRALDVAGIEAWLAPALALFARRAPVGTLIPVGHGAAAAIVRRGQLACPPMDYESPLPDAIRAEYAALRDPFSDTGSPALPDGLNLGAQLFWLSRLHAGLFAPGAQILLWPQYWAWRLCGVASSEVSSLGCHSDLWRPTAAAPTRLAERCGWSALLPARRQAGDVLGEISPEWAARTGLPADTTIRCGVHDSNAALLGARGYTDLAGREATVLSTGTWFVAMRTPGAGVTVDIGALPMTRDCLVNVDVQGQAVPSARFMGGREIELLTGPDAGRVDDPSDQPALLAAVAPVLSSGARVLPTFAPGCGPYARGRGQWRAEPHEAASRRVAICLYAALVADTSLGLIGASGRILIEGRFAASEVFARAVASLRADTQVFALHAQHDASHGALRLVQPSLASATPLRPVPPLDADLTGYARAWRQEADS